jgi:hypothetical protein
MVYDGTPAVLPESAVAPPQEWTAPEQRLWEHFRCGVELDLGELDGGRDPGGGADWPDERVIAARVLAGLLLHSPPPIPGCVPSLRLRGARITGQLDLDGARVNHQVELVECYFEEPVLARGAHTVRWSLAGSWLPELRLHNIDVDGELALERVHTTRLVDLADASVARSVRLMDADLNGADGSALLAERIRTGGALLCQGLRSDGEVRIPGARIGGIINLASAHLCSDRGTALDGNGLTVDGSLFADRRRDANDGLRTVGRVFLAGAHIAGDLDFTGALLELSPHGLAAGSRGLPPSASGPGADPDTDPTAVLVAERATIGGNLEIDDGFTARGAIRLATAVIRGNIRAVGCTIDPVLPADARPDRFSILADGLDLGGDMLCGSAFSARGEMLLRTAKIGGNLFLGRAELSHPLRNAMNIDRSTIQGNLAARHLVARGTIRMQNTAVGGSVILDGATLTDPYTTTAGGPRGEDQVVTVRPSLDARSAHVGRDIQCQASDRQPFFAAAGVRLRGAEIRKTASFRGAVLESGGGPYTLNLFGLQATELVLAVGAPPRGLVELSQVRAAAVFDNAHLWAATRGVRLEDFEYAGITAADGDGQARTLAGTEQPEEDEGRPAIVVPLPSPGEPSARGRVRWMQAALEASSTQTATVNWLEWRQWRQLREWRQWWFGRSRHHLGYTPQPYEQLAASYRAHGNDRDARYVLLARQRHRRKTRGIAGRTAGRLLDLTVGYGYRTWLALFWLGGLWAIGYAYMRHVHPPTIDSGLTGAQWSPALFTLDLLLPIIGFEQEGVFAMHGADRWVASGLELAGWLLATAVVAGFSRALQRRN